MIVTFFEVPDVDLLWHMRCSHFLAFYKVRSEPIHNKESPNTIGKENSAAGSPAVEGIIGKITSMRNEIDHWRALSVSTDPRPNEYALPMGSCGREELK